MEKALVKSQYIRGDLTVKERPAVRLLLIERVEKWREMNPERCKVPD